MAGRGNKRKGKLVPGEAAMMEAEAAAKAVANRLTQASQPAAGAVVSGADQVNLMKVIALLDELIRRASERAGQDPETKELLQILYGVGLGGTRMASMLKTHRELSSDEQDSLRKLSELIEELNLKYRGSQKG